jgi:hypothetical protein
MNKNKIIVTILALITCLLAIIFIGAICIAIFMKKEFPTEVLLSTFSGFMVGGFAIAQQLINKKKDSNNKEKEEENLAK